MTATLGEALGKAFLGTEPLWVERMEVGMQIKVGGPYGP